MSHKNAEEEVENNTGGVQRKAIVRSFEGKIRLDTKRDPLEGGKEKVRIFVYVTWPHSVKKWKTFGPSVKFSEQELKEQALTWAEKTKTEFDPIYTQEWFASGGHKTYVRNPNSKPVFGRKPKAARESVSA